MSIGLKHGEAFLENHQVEWEEYARNPISRLKEILGDDALRIEDEWIADFKGYEFGSKSL